MVSRIRIFTGRFGSGKTEVSINYEIKLAKRLYQEINIPHRYLYETTLEIKSNSVIYRMLEIKFT